MKRLLSVFVALLLSAHLAAAQTGTPQSPASLNNEVNTLFADNTIGSITPANARQTFLDMIASWTGFPNVFTVPQTFSAGGTALTLLPGDSSIGIATTAFVNPPVNTQTVNYLATSTDCGRVIQAGTGTSGQFGVFLPAAASVPVGCQLTVKNQDTTRAKILVGFPADVETRLWPLQAITVKTVNGVWSSISKPTRWLLPVGGVPFFIDNVLGSDSNDGLAAGAGAFASWNAFNSTLFNFIDTQQQDVIVTLAAGQSWSNFTMTGGPVGAGTITLNLNGNTLTGTGGNSAMTVFSGPQGNVLANAILFLRNGTITCTGGGNGVLNVGGNVGVLDGITMGACPGGAHFWTDSPIARTLVEGNYTISGGASYHWVAANGGHSDFDTPGVTITLTGTPNFTSAFAYSHIAGILITNSAFSGSATGIRYIADLGGVINTASIVLPGSVAGFVATGGIKDNPGVPAITSCGASPGAPVGTDLSGHVVEGTGATGCAFTFTTNNAPSACTVTSNNATVNSTLVVAVSSTALAIAHSAASGATVYWICPAN